MDSWDTSAELLVKDQIKLEWESYGFDGTKDLIEMADDTGFSVATTGA